MGRDSIASFGFVQQVLIGDVRFSKREVFVSRILYLNNKSFAGI